MPSLQERRLSEQDAYMRLLHGEVPHVPGTGAEEGFERSVALPKMPGCEGTVRVTRLAIMITASEWGEVNGSVRKEPLIHFHNDAGSHGRVGHDHCRQDMRVRIGHVAVAAGMGDQAARQLQSREQSVPSSLSIDPHGTDMTRGSDRARRGRFASLAHVPRMKSIASATSLE